METNIHTDHSECNVWDCSFIFNQVMKWQYKINTDYGTPCCRAGYKKLSPDYFIYQDLKNYKCRDCEKKYSLNEIEQRRKKIDKLMENND